MSDYMPDWVLGKKGWIVTGLIFYLCAQGCWSAVAFSVAGALDYDLGLFDYSDPTSEKGVLILPHLLVTAGLPMLLLVLYFVRGWLSTLFAVYRRGRVSSDASGPHCGLCGGQDKPGRIYGQRDEDPGIYLCNQCLHRQARDTSLVIAAGLMFAAAFCFLMGWMFFSPSPGRRAVAGQVVWSPFEEAMSGTWLAYILGAACCLVGGALLIGGVRFLIKPVPEAEIRMRGNRHAAQGRRWRILMKQRQKARTQNARVIEPDLSEH